MMALKDQKQMAKHNLYLQMLIGKKINLIRMKKILE